MSFKDCDPICSAGRSHFDVLISDEEHQEEEKPHEPQAPVSKGTFIQSRAVPIAADNSEGNSSSWQVSKKKPQRDSKDGTGKPSLSTSYTGSIGSYSTSYKSRGSKRSAKDQPPLALSDLKIETTVELHDFPATYRTSDLKKLLAPFEGHFRLKWQNDNSCWAVFDDQTLALQALTDLADPVIKLRRFNPENAAFATSSYPSEATQA